MTEALAKYNADAVRDRIFTVRGQKIILDSDLAAIYGVATKVLNQAVKRNADKFPDDFMFRLTKSEAEDMRCSRSQSVTLKRGQNIKYLPHAFTEHGAIMVATVLNSPRAVQMSVFVVRAFVRMRAALTDRSLRISTFLSRNLPNKPPSPTFSTGLNPMVSTIGLTVLSCPAFGAPYVGSGARACLRLKTRRPSYPRRLSSISVLRRCHCGSFDASNS